MSDDHGWSAIEARARELLEGLLQRMGFEARVESSTPEEGEVWLEVHTPDASRLIGRGAQMLDAVQYVLNRMVQRQTLSDARCVVDVERYRARQRERLVEEAQAAAAHVRRTGEPYVFEPMHAGDRRVVHQALKNETDLQTVSGAPDERGNKCLTVRAAPAAPPPAPGEVPAAGAPPEA